MGHEYLVRYGLMSRVGRFTSGDDQFDRGSAVVLRTNRGTELGEVLVPAPSTGLVDTLVDGPNAPRVLRAALPEDLERAHEFERDRPRRFEVCQRVVADGDWPLELLDVEPLLDERRTVLHYLGPHHADVADLISALRAASGLDVMLEPVGRDLPEPEATDHHAGGCGSCGTGGGGCGSGGSCGIDSASGHGGCADCGVKKLMSRARGATAATS